MNGKIYLLLKFIDKNLQYLNNNIDMFLYKNISREVLKETSAFLNLFYINFFNLSTNLVYIYTGFFTIRVKIFGYKNHNNELTVHS